ADQLLPYKREQVAWNGRACRFGRQMLDGTAVEHLSLDRAALDRRTLLRLQAVEPRRDERVNRRGNLHVGVVLTDQCGELLDVERVALRGLEDPRAQRLVEFRREICKQLRALFIGERPKPDRRSP